MVGKLGKELRVPDTMLRVAHTLEEHVEPGNTLANSTTSTSLALATTGWLCWT